MAACFSAERCRGGRRLRGAHLPLRSIDFDNLWVDLCGQGPDRCREYVYSLQRLLSCSGSSGKPANVIMAMILSGISGFTLSGRISNGSVFHSMSSSSWLLSMRVDSSIGVKSANASTWGRRRRFDGTRGRSGLFIDNEQRVLSYPCITNGVHVVQGCAQTRLNFASDGVTGVTDWLRWGLELVVSSK